MNIPNILSVFRLVLVPVAAYMFHINNTVAAFLTFVFACLTDILDGYIARRFNMITKLGKVLDPVADKAMQITVIFCMALHDLMPFAVVFLIIIKELFQCLGGMLLLSKNVEVSANWYGKVSTVVVSLSVGIILLFEKNINGTFVMTFFQWLPAFFAAYAFAQYFILFLKLLKGNSQGE